MKYRIFVICGMLFSFSAFAESKGTSASARTSVTNKVLDNSAMLKALLRKNEQRVDFQIDPNKMKKDMLPDFPNSTNAVTVEGESITWGALRELAELNVNSKKMPFGDSSAEDVKKIVSQLTMRRIKALASRFAVKAMFAHEAKRQGVKLDSAKIEKQRGEVLSYFEKKGKRNWVETYRKPGSFFSHELTNEMYIIEFRKQILAPKIVVTEAEIRQAIVDRVATNEARRAYNIEQKKMMESKRAKILSGEETFENVADEISNCDSSLEGGAWGTFTEEKLIPELWTVATNLPLNQLGPVVETPYSFDMLKVTKLHYPIGTLPGTSGVKPVSLEISHIMRDKKVDLPLLTPETAKVLVLHQREKAELIKVEKRLRETIKVESIIPVDVDMKKKSAFKRVPSK